MASHTPRRCSWGPPQASLPPDAGSDLISPKAYGVAGGGAKATARLIAMLSTMIMLIIKKIVLRQSRRPRRCDDFAIRIQASMMIQIDADYTIDRKTP
jgi:hypothetical protein